MSQKLRPTKANMEHLIRTKKTSTHGTTNLIVGTCNTQSLRNKDLQVTDLLNDYSMDILALTETWLTDNQFRDMVPEDLHLSGFGDDHSIRKAFKAGNKQQEMDTKATMKSCMLKIKHWMDTVHLKMNPSKTEFIYFRGRQQLKKCLAEDLNLAGDFIIRSHSIKYLGTHLDENLKYKQHVNKKCQAAMYNYFKIRSIRKLLDIPTGTCLCLSLCISYPDYCNSLLYGLPDTTINRLQRVQNMCACLILRTGKRDSISQCLKELYWMPI